MYNWDSRSSKVSHCWYTCGEISILLHWLLEYKNGQSHWKRIWQYFVKVYMHSLFDTAITLLGIYLEDTPPTMQKNYNVNCQSNILRAKYWKQDKCPPNKKLVECTIVHSQNKVLRNHEKRMEKISTNWYEIISKIYCSI